MNAKEVLSKYKPIIIIILLLSVVFFLRAEAVNISGVPDQYKSLYQDPSGLPYFSEMDSYYNYRMTQDYLDHGYLGDTIINGTNWDLHSNFPPGKTAEYTPLIVYITAFTYKFVNLFKEVPLTNVCFWIAPLVASLCVIPAYLFIRRITNDYGGIVAALLAGTAYFYFSHSYAGFFDTDMFNVIFPILIVWFFVESIRANDIRKVSIFAALSVISMFLFSTAWNGWWYIFYIIVGVAIVYIIAAKLLGVMAFKSPKKYSSIFEWFIDQKVLFALVFFIIGSSILLIISLGPSGFINSLFEPFVYSQLQSSVSGTAYPNVFISVSELQIPTFDDVARGVGGLIALIVGIASVPLLIWKMKPRKDKDKTKQEAPKIKKKPRRKGRRKNTSENVEKTTVKKEVKIDNKLLNMRREYLLYVVLLSIWLLITAFAMTKGSRFIETFAIPIALGAGIFVGLITPSISDYIKNAKFQKYLPAIAVALILIVAGPSVYTSYVVATSVGPSADDSFYNSMVWVKGNTAQNTVITSWWDYGHLYATVGDRPVTFDGGSQNSARSYWVGKALLTSDENLSAGILRMLTSSGDLGYLTLENYTKDTGKSVEILDKILPVSKQSAQTILVNDYKLTTEQAQNVLKYTHPDNPSPHVFITSSDMLGKASWWSYFGSWDFKTSQGQHYIYSAAQATTKQVNGTVVIQAENGVVAQVNGTQLVAGLQYTQNNETQVIPAHKLIVIQNNKTVMNQVISSDSPVSIMLIQEGNAMVAIAMNKELEDSMFTKLFLMRGAGLSKFKLAHADSGVMTWNVS